MDVNEQNLQAVTFYERLGFVRAGRSPNDREGRPYPLFHMRMHRMPARYRRRLSPLELVIAARSR